LRRAAQLRASPRLRRRPPPLRRRAAPRSAAARKPKAEAAPAAAPAAARARKAKAAPAPAAKGKRAREAAAAPAAAAAAAAPAKRARKQQPAAAAAAAAPAKKKRAAKNPYRGWVVLNKTDSKSRYCLNDKDLSALECITVPNPGMYCSKFWYNVEHLQSAADAKFATRGGLQAYKVAAARAAEKRWRTMQARRSHAS
jgi:hypothetical protein